jgi:hypothetical protein
LMRLSIFCRVCGFDLSLAIYLPSSVFIRDSNLV